MRRCAVAALVLSTQWIVAIASTSVRVSIPDLAGMLYPAQSHGRVTTFAVPSASLQPLYAPRLGANDPAPSCDSSVLCLDIAWASAYPNDPFVLVAMASTLPFGSRTFDNAPPSTNTTSWLPIIQGANDSRTLWRFHALSAANPSIDVLFRLRQQSQLRAVRDQLLVHIVATQLDNTTERAAIETYSVYGNQRVEHAVIRTGPKQLRLNIDITRNASRADVVLQDAYPLVPIIQTPEQVGRRWRVVDSDCRRCTAQLLGCASTDDLESGACAFDTTTADIPTCLRNTRGLTTAWFQSVLSGPVGGTSPMTRMLWACLSTVYTRETVGDTLPSKQSQSWALTSALSCLAARQCPFGPMYGLLDAPQSSGKMLRLTNPVPSIFRIEWPAAQGLSGVIAVTIGGGPDGDPTFQVTRDEIITSDNTTDDVAQLLASVLSGLESVQVDVKKSVVDTTAMFDITIFNFPVDFYLNFVPAASMAVSITPMNSDGGMTFVRVAELTPTSLILETDCDRCVSELEACRGDDACRYQVLPCVGQVMSRVDTSSAYVDATFGTYRVDILPTLASLCFANVAVASWNPIRRALACVSRYQCRMDTSPNSPASNEPTFFVLSNGTQVVAVPVEVSPTGSTMVNLNISTPASTLHFYSTVDTLATFVRAFVLGNAADVYVNTQAYAADASKIQLQLTYANSLLPWTPSFTGSSGVIVIDDAAPKGALDFVDATTFSVKGLQATIAPFLSLYVDPASLATASTYPWNLAPECVACSASFYGCSPSQVLQKSCLYDNATSPLAQCIRQTFPRGDFVSLLNTPAPQDGSSPSRVVTTDVTRCIQTATSVAGDTPPNRFMLTRTLSCFAASQCPFGPLDLVDSTRMVQLTASTYLQTLRIPTRQFRLDLSASMGKYQIATVTITESDSVSLVLNQALAPFGLMVHAESSFTGTEWTIMISYNNVVASDFNVEIAATSVPPPGVIGQAVLRPATRLVVSPRLVSRVYLTTEVATPAPTDVGSSPPPPDTTTTPPTAPAPQLLMFSDECAQCDSTHLTACGHSDYCRRSFASCLSTYLGIYTVQDIAQPMPDGTISADLASILRSCAESGATFFDWWEPIQRWLGCYASARCPINTQDPNRVADAYLEFVPAVVTINTTTADQWSGQPGDVELTLTTPWRYGSSLWGRTTTASSKEGLQATCEHASQGVSRVAVSTAARTDTPGTFIRAVYEDPFFGDLPFPIGPSTAVRGSLLVRSTSNATVTASAWTGLTDKLSNYLASTPLPPSSCSTCATAFVQQCAGIPACIDSLLQCLVTGVEGNYISLPDSDRSIYQAIVGCTHNLMASDWWPVQKYFVCMRDLQCVVSDPSMGPAYVRLHSGHLRLSIDTSLQSTPDWIRVSFKGNMQPPLTIAILRYVLQTVLEGMAVIEMKVKPVDSSGTNQVVDIFFHDYIGELPDIASVYGGLTVDTWLPDVVVYSPNTVDTSVVSSDLRSLLSTTAPTPTPPPLLLFTESCAQCDSIHLQACARSDFCRNVVAACFSSALGAVSYEDVSASATKSVDLVSYLRGCVGPSFFDWWEPIQRWLGCYASSRCPITRQDPSRTTDAYLEFAPLVVDINTTVVDLWGSTPASIDFEASSAESSSWGRPITVSTKDELQAACWYASQVVSPVTVSMSALQGGQGTAIRIVYTDPFFGTPILPSDSNSIVSGKTWSVGRLDVRWTAGYGGGEAWDGLQDRLSFLLGFGSGNPTSCGACATVYLQQCRGMPACQYSLLQCLSTNVEDQFTSRPMTDRSIYQAIVGCTHSLMMTDWWPVQKYLLCMRNLQCVVSDHSLGPAYIRLFSGHLRLTIDPALKTTAPTLQLTADWMRVSFRNNVQWPSETSDLRYVLQTMLEGLAVVEVLVQPPYSSGTNEIVDIYFHDYIGELPEITSPYNGLSVVTWSPDVVFYSLNTVDSIVVSSALAKYVPRPLEFSSDCVQCDSVYLPACARSTYCREPFARCLSSTLGYHSFGEFASDDTTTVDLAEFLRSCDTGNAFFDWWEPIQRWLGCYAAARCPISRLDVGRTTDAYLEFVPMVVDINTTVYDFWGSTPGYMEMTSTSAGSSTWGRPVTVSTKEELQAACERASQGSSQVTVTTSPLSGSTGTAMRIVYTDPFFGSPLIPTDANSIVSGKTWSPARLLVRWSSGYLAGRSWDGLVDKLAYLFSLTPVTARSCSECALYNLLSCRSSQSCQGYLLECLSGSIENHYVSLPVTDRSIYQALLGCSRALTVADSQPVLKYLTCMRDLQCAVGDPTFGSSYLRLQTGHLRVSLDTSILTSLHDWLTVAFEGNTQSPTTISEFSTILQSMIGNTGVVEMKVTSPTQGSTMEQIDIFFHDYIGKLPEVTYSGEIVQPSIPDVVIYSLSTVDSSALSTTLANYMVEPQCSGICEDHLARCVRGDSLSSLVCRYEMLPCVADLITTKLSSHQAGIWSSDSKSVVFTDDLRACFSSNYEPMESIARYFGCLAPTGCTLNSPQSTSAKVDLMFQPGEQDVSVFGSRIVGMVPPPGMGTSALQTFDFQDADNFKWNLKSLIMNSLADVAVADQGFFDSSQDLIVTYLNYLGFLPAAQSADMSVSQQSDLVFGFSSSDRIDASQWDRLDTTLQSFIADKSSACTSCMTNTLLSCPTCLSIVIPSLLMMLGDTTSSSSSTFPLTDIFYKVVDTMPVAEWLPVAQALKCWMVNGCPLSSDSATDRPPSSTATFAVISPATMTLTVPNSMPQSALFTFARPPNHSMNAPVDPDVTQSFSISRDDNYALLRDGLPSILETAGQSPKVQVTERDGASGSPNILLDIVIDDFFGWIPTYATGALGGNVLLSTLPQIVGQTYGNVPGASITALVSTLESYKPPSTPSAKVLTGACGDCAAQFYGCTASDIASGICSYTTATSNFVTCLRQHVPPSVFYGVGRAVDTTYVLYDALSECFSVTGAQDTLANSFQTDSVTAVNGQLACFELHFCAFGPLDDGLMGGNMIQLQSTNLKKSFAIAGATFNAVFHATFGRRATDSASFNEASTDDELWTLLSGILPQADIAVTMAPLPDTSGFMVSVTIKNVYFPNLYISVTADTTVANQAGEVTPLSALRTVALDTSFIDNAS